MQKITALKYPLCFGKTSLAEKPNFFISEKG